MRKNFYFSTLIIFSLVTGSLFLFSSEIFAQGGGAFPSLDDFSLQMDDDEEFALDDAGEYELPDDDLAAMGGEGLIIADSEPEIPRTTLKTPVPPPAVAPGANAPKTAVPAPSTADVPAPYQEITQPTLPVPAQKPQPTAAVQRAAAPQIVTTDTYYCRDCRLPGLLHQKRNVRRTESYVIPAPVRQQPMPYYYEPAGRARGYHGPMIDPYYTLRGPRHFDDPNPRPIGP